MLFTKMNGIIDEVNAKVSEREELAECIALSLLSGKNLFILGDTGQAKSFCINEFRKRITGARQFERLMSKQTDEEQLFGRLDLASIIPGNASEAELSKNATYADCMEELREAYEKYEADKSEENLRRAAETAKRTEVIRHILCMLKSDKPRMITDGKIPDSHIVFLDEIFKSN
ncbi:MAG: AAA family ATPase, partial [Oscillospiraceae bacterium]|nr:AAA family ATPase [Oscillospiraceae bacterium]